MLAFLATAVLHGPQPCPGSLGCSLRVLLLSNLAGAVTAFCLFIGMQLRPLPGVLNHLSLTATCRCPEEDNILLLSAGSVVLNIVTTEHVQFALPGDSDPNRLLFAALQADEVMYWLLFL